MKARFVIIPLSVFITISWALFLFALYIFSEENFKVKNTLDEIHNKLDDVNDTTNILWRERIFEKEIRENFAYHLPEEFTSNARYIAFSPLDLEHGKARVYFIYRYNNYKVDFSYYFEGNKLKIDRDSKVELTQ